MLHNMQDALHFNTLGHDMAVQLIKLNIGQI